jgi:hypothetical protein
LKYRACRIRRPTASDLIRRGEGPFRNGPGSDRVATFVTEPGACGEVAFARGASQTQAGAAPEAEVRPGGGSHAGIVDACLTRSRHVPERAEDWAQDAIRLKDSRPDGDLRHLEGPGSLVQRSSTGRGEFGRLVAERTCSLCVLASTLVPTSCCSYPDTDGYEQPKGRRPTMGVSTTRPWSRRSTGLGSGASLSRARCVRARWCSMLTRQTE